MMIYYTTGINQEKTEYNDAHEKEAHRIKCKTECTTARNERIPTCGVLILMAIKLFN